MKATPGQASALLEKGPMVEKNLLFPTVRTMRVLLLNPEPLLFLPVH